MAKDNAYSFLMGKLEEAIYQINPESQIDFTRISFPQNFPELVKFCQSNRLNYHIAAISKQDENIPDEVKYVINQWDDEFTRYKNTMVKALNSVQECLQGKKWLLIKTLSTYPHFTSDIDVLVKSRAIADMAKVDAQKYPNEYGEEILPIDIDYQWEISWTRSQEIGDEFIWAHVEHATFQGIEYARPDETFDSLLRLGHMPFEQAEIRLGEMLHIFAQLKRSNWEDMIKEARLNGWEKTFWRIISLLARIHFALYGHSLHKKYFNESTFSANIVFPYSLSYMMLLQAVIEKKAWNKIWGARLILKDRLFG